MRQRSYRYHGGPSQRGRAGGVSYGAVARGWFVERRTLVLAALSTVSVGLLLFALGTLIGAQWAARRWVPAHGAMLASLPMPSPPGAGRTTPLGLGSPPPEPPSAVPAPAAVVEAPTAMPEVAAIDTEIFAPLPAVATAPSAPEPLLPDWARDGLLAEEATPPRLTGVPRLSRGFHTALEPGALAHPTAIDLGPDGRPQLRFLATHQPPAVPFGDLIYRTARRHALNPRLLAAVIGVESSFDPRAVSHRGARGLMQVMPDTAHRFGVPPKELFDPESNLSAGARYLGWLSDRYGDDLPRVLAAYNAGEGAVDRYGGIPPFNETREYVARAYSALGLTAPEAVRRPRPGGAG